MSAQPVVIYLPDDIRENYQKMALASNRTLEDVVVETLRQNLPDSDDEWNILYAASDDELWQLVKQSLMPAQKLRLAALTEKNKSAVGLTPTEKHELDNLLEKIDENMIGRSRALVVLQERGQDVSHFFGTTSD